MNQQNITEPYEEWRNVVGYEGLYQISNLGRVKSLETPARNVKPYLNSDGYFTLGLIKDNKRKLHLVHRLVAQAFIPNPDNLPIINHKDEDKTNNVVGNLEWCTIGYNVTYGSAKEKAARKQRMKICQYNGNGELVNVWERGQHAATSLNIGLGGIVKCYQGRIPCFAGYVWRKHGEAFDKYTLPTADELLCIKQPTAYDAGVVQYDREGNVINSFSSMYEAEKNAKTTRALILKCCKGELVTSGKCIWRYTDDPFDKYPTRIERIIAEETKEKLRQYHLNSDYTKQVSQPIGMFDDEWRLIKIYPSITQAVKDKGQGVIKVLKGERIHCKGFRWRGVTA